MVVVVVVCLLCAELVSPDPGNAALLYSQATLLGQQGKAQASARSLSQARATPQGARALQFVADAEAAFDRVAAAGH